MVLFASYSGSLGGAERLMLEFADALGRDCALACPPGALAQAAREHGFRVFPVPVRSLNVRARASDRVLAPLRLIAHAIELRALAHQLDPDLIVAWGMRSALACLIGPSLPWPIAFQHNDLLPGALTAWLVRAAAARAEVVTVPSQATARDLDPAGRLGAALQVVRPGVRVGEFEADAGAELPPAVIVLGALTRVKRPEFAIAACALARRRVPGLRLRFVGAPLEADAESLESELRERATAAGIEDAVEFVGHVPDPSAELSRASCLLHCAAREAFGLAVLEALAAGRPAVVPAAGGPAEIVDHSCGLLYPAGDRAAAADALVTLLSDRALAARKGAAGRARARAHFDPESARRRWATVVSPLIRAHERGPADSLELVTVTHNSGSALRGLLSSVNRHLPGSRIVVVDCASTDDSVQVAREGGAHVIALERNVGFGRACNVGVAAASARVTALVNPDVELLDRSLIDLAGEALRRDGAERLLAPLVLSPDGSRQDTVHPIPSSWPDLASAIVSPALLPGRVGATLAPWRSTGPRPVGWAVGCALVARTETLRRLGPFEEAIFLFGEDLDLCLRARDAGVQTWFWPRTRVIHHGAHSTLQAFGGEPFELLARARHEVVARRLGARHARLDDAAQMVTFGSRVIAKRALGRATGRERRQLIALRAALRSDERR